MDAIEDIHICGACKTEFSDIYKFLEHKRSCHHVIQGSTSSISAPLQQELATNSLNQEVKCNQILEETIQIANANVCEGSGGVQYCQESFIPKDGSLVECSHSIYYCTSEDQTMPEAVVSGWDSKATISDESSVPYSLANIGLENRSNIMLQSDINSSSGKYRVYHESPEEKLTENVAVYLVSSQSQQAIDAASQVKMPPQIDEKDRFVWSNSEFHEQHLSLVNKPHANLADKPALGIDHNAQTAIVSKNVVREQLSCLPVGRLDGEVASHGSTPCPEDLEVGQISAAMAGTSAVNGALPFNSSQQTRGKDTGLLMTFPVNHLNAPSGGNAEESPVCAVSEYLRENTASAPPMKCHPELHCTRKLSLEKRERLQGVSDDLLSSPYLPRLPQSSSIPLEGGHLTDEVALPSSNGSLNVPVTSQSMSTVTSYKAVFTSPSSAGHRLAPKDELVSSVQHSSWQDGIQAGIGQSATLYRNISASIQAGPAQLVQTPCGGIDKKVDRRIDFEKAAQQGTTSAAGYNFDCLSVEGQPGKISVEDIGVPVSEQGVLPTVSRTDAVQVLHSGHSGSAAAGDHRINNITFQLDLDGTVKSHQANYSVLDLDSVRTQPEEGAVMVSDCHVTTGILQYPGQLVDQSMVVSVDTGSSETNSHQLETGQGLNQQLPPCLPEERERYIMKPRPRRGRPAPQDNLEGTLCEPITHQELVHLAAGQKKLAVGASLQGKRLAGTSSQNVEKEVRKFKCKYNNCSYSTSQLKDSQRHQRTHTGECPYVCKECGRSFSRSDKLKIHMRSHLGIKPFQCKYCSYAAVEAGSLKKHLRTHTDERPFKCQICSYASRNSSHLIVHLRSHTGDTPFHCHLCSAQFKINSDLTRHLRIHTGEKPFPCSKCDYKSTNAGNLKTHMRINHSAANEKKCSKCDFTSSSAKKFRVHVKSHDTRSVVKCTQCEYTCANLNALRNHVSIHNPVRPFQCYLCSYSTKQRGNLKKHLQNIHYDNIKSGRHGKKFTSSETVSSLERTSQNAQHAPTSAHSEPAEGVRPRRGTSYRKLHQCPQCGCGFVRADSLRSHLRQHSVSQAKTSPSKPACSAPKVRGSIHHIAAAASRALQEQFASQPEGSGYLTTVSEDLARDKLLGSQASPLQEQLPWEHRSYTLSVDRREEAASRSKPGGRPSALWDTIKMSAPSTSSNRQQSSRKISAATRMKLPPESSKRKGRKRKLSSGEKHVTPPSAKSLAYPSGNGKVGETRRSVGETQMHGEVSQSSSQIIEVAGLQGNLSTLILSSQDLLHQQLNLQSVPAPPSATHIQIVLPGATTTPARTPNVAPVVEVAQQQTPYPAQQQLLVQVQGPAGPTLSLPGGIHIVDPATGQQHQVQVPLQQLAPQAYVQHATSTSTATGEDQVQAEIGEVQVHIIEQASGQGV